jgi:hypothetical protein
LNLHQRKKNKNAKKIKEKTFVVPHRFFKMQLKSTWEAAFCGASVANNKCPVSNIGDSISPLIGLGL